MNNTTLQIKFKQRLNKLASDDFDNIQCWEIVEAFNKAQLEWCRRQLRGSNLFKDGDEASKRRVDDLQVLLKTMGLSGEDIEYDDKFGYFESDNFKHIYDDDYLEFKRIETKAAQVITGPCEGGTPFIPGSPPTPPIPGTPEIPEITEEVVIQEATPEVLAEYVDIPGTYTHPTERCAIGFYMSTPGMQPLPPGYDYWDIRGHALYYYNTGDYTLEELNEMYPIVECTFDRVWDCDGNVSEPWEDEAFCDCVSSWMQFEPGTDDTSCSNVVNSANLAYFQWLTETNFPVCTEIPDSQVACTSVQEGWFCFEGPNEGEEFWEGYVCVEAQEEITETVIVQEGVPATPDIPGTPGTPDIPAVEGTGEDIIHPQANINNCCKDTRSMTCYLSEVGNTDVILRDPLKNPDFDWAETVVTMQENEIRIWRKDFFIVDPKLIYYRKPVFIQVKGCVDPYTNKESLEEIECEFKDDIVELIIDEAVSIVAGDIMDVNQFARGSQSAEKNN